MSVVLRNYLINSKLIMPEVTLYLSGVLLKFAFFSTKLRNMLVSPFHSTSLNFVWSSICQLIIVVFLIILTINLWLKFLFFRRIFISLMILNYRGLTPFYWSFTSYFWRNILVSLCIWTTLIAVIISKNLEITLRSLLPLNSPKLLWIFLIYLEIVRQMIRPMTLGLRLTCNILTGHVLLRLLRSRILLPFLSCILIFEIIVAVIQTRVFSLLALIYKTESN